MEHIKEGGTKSGAEELKAKQSRMASSLEPLKRWPRPVREAKTAAQDVIRTAKAVRPDRFSGTVSAYIYCA